MVHLSDAPWLKKYYNNKYIKGGKEKMEKEVTVEKFKPVNVFVYGTLKKGHGNHHILGDSKSLGNAELLGSHYQMYDGGFPYLRRVVRGEDGRYIIGEVYEVTKKSVMDSLDRLEGVPHHYVHHHTQAFLRDPGHLRDEISVVVYVASKEVSDRLVATRMPMNANDLYVEWPPRPREERDSLNEFVLEEDDA